MVWRLLGNQISCAQTSPINQCIGGVGDLLFLVHPLKEVPEGGSAAFPKMGVYLYQFEWWESYPFRRLRSGIEAQRPTSTLHALFTFHLENGVPF